MFIPTVAVLIINGNQVLLVKHGPAAKHVNDVCGLPSGHIEDGETEIAAAVRELEEETGLKTTEDDLEEFPQNYYTARIPLKDGSNKEYGWRVYLCHKYEGSLRATDETEPFWAKVSDLDSLNLLPNVKEAVYAGLSYLGQRP